MKTCSRCGKEKPEAEFHGRWRSNDRLQAWCASCHSEYAADYYQTVKEARAIKYHENRAAVQFGRLLRRYSITAERYDDLLRLQDRECFGCGTPYGLQVDHDHTCCPGKSSCGRCVRGFLCPPCNKALGFASDSPEVLRNLALYLHRHTRPTRSNA